MFTFQFCFKTWITFQSTSRFYYFNGDGFAFSFFSFQIRALVRMVLLSGWRYRFRTYRPSFSL